MDITKEWLEQKNACEPGIVWFENQEETEVVKIINKLLNYDQFDWANWLITQFLDRKRCVWYAIYVARLVLHIYETKFPGDNKSRKAIEVAEKCLNADDAARADAADDARAIANNIICNEARKAYGVGVSVGAAYAAYAAAYAANAAANDANDVNEARVAYAAYFAADAAVNATVGVDVVDVVNATVGVVKEDIIKYAIKLITEED